MLYEHASAGMASEILLSFKHLEAADFEPVYLDIMLPPKHIDEGKRVTTMHPQCSA